MSAEAMAAMAAAAIDEEEAGDGATSPQRREIEALYAANNPEKLADVPALVAKYGEDKLLSMVRKKYRVATGSSPLAAAPSLTPSPSTGLPVAFATSLTRYSKDASAAGSPG